ncbi:MAG: DUF4337 domain-containing protein [Planctomycetes bacterium]|nr:DUF4337 domain-containing protein [Planctomycetota bacterium]MBI3835504.1 DUF4337 domain-containing protein [Planctomycetota bacterium]
MSLSTAMLAVVAAIAALESASLANEALLEQIRAAQLQARASDEWAFFQAKGLKAHMAIQTVDLLSANHPGSDQTGKYQQEADRYRREQTELETKAKEFERQRDEKEHESQRLMHRHHPFAYCVTFTQIAIALSAIAALTSRRPIWYASMLVGIVGVVFLALGFSGGG